MSDFLLDSTEYTLGELVLWFSSRSRICSTSLWPLALQGRAVFEVGEYTYKSTPISSDLYLINSVGNTVLLDT